MKKNITGRSAPCPCGSGKKYKKCCLLKNKKGYVSDYRVSGQATLNAPPIKISGAIIKLAEPLLKKYQQQHRIIVLIDLAIIAWNISLIPEDKREDTGEKLIEHFPEEIDLADIATIVEQVDHLVERKNKLFPNIRHVIIDHKLSFEHGNLTLDINSTPIDDDNFDKDNKA